MPELPDLAVLAEGLGAALIERPVRAVQVVDPLVVRATPAETAALAGQRLLGFTRRGKFLTLQLERDRVVIAPMLTGRLGLAPSGARPWKSTPVVLEFAPGRAADAPAGASWTIGADWLPPTDQPIELRYRDPTRMGKVYVVPADTPRPIAGWDEQGPDADDPALDLAAWRTRIARHRGELKGVLKNQVFVAGIGNGYSDEIAWASRLAPFRPRNSLAGEEVDALYTATRAVLPWAIAELRQRVPPRFEVEVRDFLRVHRKGGQPCPRCGARLSEVQPGGFVTTFCRGCQR